MFWLERLFVESDKNLNKKYENELPDKITYA
jgi:hypothetical protein